MCAATALAQNPQPMYKVTKAVTPPDEDAEIVFDIPDGVATSYSRNCRSFKNDYIDGVTNRSALSDELHMDDIPPGWQ